MANRSLPTADSWRFVESRWDLAATWLLAALLAFMPLALGAVEAWSELVVVIAAGVLAVGLALRLVVDPTFHLARTWAYAPLIAAVGLAACQTIPLPADLLAQLSPEAARLRTELLDPAFGTRGTTTAPLSLYPLETTHDLRMALVFVALFTIVAATFRDTRQIKRLLTTIFVIGCIEGAIGLLQIATFSKKILWITAERDRIVTSGTFINYSHFCQFVNLCLGAGVGLLLVRMREDDRRSPHRGHPGSGSRYGLHDWERYAPLLAGVGLCILSVFTSMSRTGVLSLLAGIAAASLLLRLRRRSSTRGWLLATAPAAVVVVLLLTRFDVVYERLATLTQGDALKLRYETTAGVLRAWRDFPLFGAGLGVHEYIFPLYDLAATPAVAEHADNDWAQLLEEFGLVGAAAVVAFLLAIAIDLGRLMAGGQTSLATAAFGLSIGFVATAIHSFSDFGQHLPAVFSTTAVLSGLVVAIRGVETRSTQRRPVVTLGWQKIEASRWFRGALLGVVLSTYGWAGVHAFASFRAEQWSGAAIAIESDLLQSNWVGDDPTYIDLIAAAERAFAWRPRNARLGYQANVYRWRAVSRAAVRRSGQLVLDPSVIPFVQQIVTELAQIRALCPTYGPPYGLEGELRRLVLSEPEGRELIEHAARLAPYHWPSCLLAGELTASDGNADRASVLLDRSVLLNPQLFEPVARLYLDVLERPDLARRLAGADDGRLEQLARLLREGDVATPGDLLLADQIEAEAVELLRKRVARGEATPDEVARLAAIRLAANNHDDAILLYRKALARRYAQVGWRLELARLLETTGEIKQATRELKIVLRLRPGHRGAREALTRLSLLPDTER